MKDRKFGVSLVLLAGGLSVPACQPLPSWDAQCANGSGQQVITFLHVNDLHASYAPSPADVSSWSRVKALHARVLMENPYTVFTDGGDVFEKGTLADTLSHGRATIEMVRAMQFDVRVMGNHDFAYGLEPALELSWDPHAQTLASNLRYTGEDSEAWGAVDFARLQVGCVTVGFLGMTSRPYNEKNQEFDGNYFPQLEGDYDFVSRARTLVEQHRSGVDVMVMLSHLGLPDDLRVAREVPGIDLVLGGHTHDQTPTPLEAGGALVVHAGRSAQLVARMDVVVDLKRRGVADHRFRLLSNSHDPQTLSKDWPWQDEQDSWKDAFLATAHDPTRVARSLAALHLPTFDVDIDRLSRDLVSRHAPDAQNALACLVKELDTWEVANLVARAAVDVLDADVAMVDPGIVHQPWKRGLLMKQGLLDTFPVEVQPPGTAGHTAMVTVLIPGKLLDALRENTPQRAWQGNAVVDPDRDCILALSRQDLALLLADQPLIVVGSGSTEMWKVAEAAALKGLAGGKHADACPVPPIPELPNPPM